MTAPSPTKDSVLHLSVQDEMTIYTAVAQKAELLAHLQDSQEVELDLSAVSEIDGAGLQILLLLKREADRNNKKLHLINHSNAVIDLFEVVGLDRHFCDEPVATPVSQDR